MPELSATYIPVGALTEEQQKSMFALFRRYYADTSQDRFRADLAEKDGLIMLRDAKGAIRGFSTLVVSSHEIDGLKIRALFSGDTIIDHRYWGEHAFAFAWLRHAGRIKRQAPDIPLYWFLIVKGFRTYRFLRVFARRFYPSHEHPMPDDIRRIRDHLALAKFGDAYDPRTGIVHFPQPRGRLREPWLTLPSSQKKSPDAAFFLRSNPRHDIGDELVCLAEISADNMPPFAARIFSSGS